MSDRAELPPYIYGREAGQNERVYTEASLIAYATKALEADQARIAELEVALREAAGTIRNAARWVESKKTGEHLIDAAERAPLEDQRA